MTDIFEMLGDLCICGHKRQIHHIYTGKCMTLVSNCHCLSFECKSQCSTSAKTKILTRDPKRIDRIIKKLQRVWKQCPDFRLGQLVSNLLGPGRHDVFYPEDDVFEAELDRLLVPKRRIVNYTNRRGRRKKMNISNNRSKVNQ